MHIFHDKSSQRGEIVTLLTIGTVLVLGIATIVSSAFLKSQTVKTNTRAAEGSCRDNPVAPPSGYSWRALCNGEEGAPVPCTGNSSCPVGANNQSGWCFGFDATANDNGARCLKLVSSQSPTQPPANNSCTPNGLKGTYCDTWTTPNQPFLVETHYNATCDGEYYVVPNPKKDCNSTAQPTNPPAQSTATPVPRNTVTGCTDFEFSNHGSNFGQSYCINPSFYRTCEANGSSSQLTGHSCPSGTTCTGLLQNTSANPCIQNTPVPIARANTPTPVRTTSPVLHTPRQPGEACDAAHACSQNYQCKNGICQEYDSAIVCSDQASISVCSQYSPNCSWCNYYSKCINPNAESCPPQISPTQPPVYISPAVDNSNICYSSQYQNLSTCNGLPGLCQWCGTEQIGQCISKNSACPTNPGVTNTYSCGDYASKSLCVSNSCKWCAGGEYCTDQGSTCQSTLGTPSTGIFTVGSDTILDISNAQVNGNTVIF